MTETCTNCKFMDIRMITMDGEKTPHEVCRRFPPQVVQTDTGASSLWPLVHAEDWCGEWDEKVEPKQETVRNTHSPAYLVCSRYMQEEPHAAHDWTCLGADDEVVGELEVFCPGWHP